MRKVKSTELKISQHYVFTESRRAFKVIAIHKAENKCFTIDSEAKERQYRLNYLNNLLIHGELKPVHKKIIEIHTDDDRGKINSKKCRTFIQDLTDAERIYCGHIIDIVLALRQLIGEEKDGKMGVSEFCKHFHIQPNKYIKFIGGDWEYALMDTVRLSIAQEIITKRRNDKRI